MSLLDVCIPQRNRSMYGFCLPCQRSHNVPKQCPKTSWTQCHRCCKFSCERSLLLTEQIGPYTYYDEQEKKLLVQLEKVRAYRKNFAWQKLRLHLRPLVHNWKNHRRRKRRAAWAKLRSLLGPLLRNYQSKKKKNF